MRSEVALIACSQHFMMVAGKQSHGLTRVFVRYHRDAQVQMAFYDLPNGGHIELVAPTGPGSAMRPALDKFGP
jgi:hypothetical protein